MMLMDDVIKYTSCAPGTTTSFSIPYTILVTAEVMLCEQYSSVHITIVAHRPHPAASCTAPCVQYFRKLKSNLYATCNQVMRTDHFINECAHLSTRPFHPELKVNTLLQMHGICQRAHQEALHSITLCTNSSDFHHSPVENSNTVVFIYAHHIHHKASIAISFFAGQDLLQQ